MGMRSLIFILVLPLSLLMSLSVGVLYYQHLKTNLETEIDKNLLKTTQYLLTKNLPQQNAPLEEPPVGPKGLISGIKGANQVDLVFILRIAKDDFAVKWPRRTPKNQNHFNWLKSNKKIFTNNRHCPQGKLLYIPREKRTARLALAPVTSPNNKNLFWAAIVLPETFESIVSPYLYGSIGLSLALVFLGLGLATALAKLLSRPLTELTLSANKLAKGDLEHEIRASGYLEVESLGRHLDVMRTSLAHRNKTQEKTIKALNNEIAQRRKAKKLLQKNETYFRSLLENTTDIITVLDPSGEIRYSSPAITRILGYDPKEVHKHNMLEFISKDDMPNVLKAMEQALTEPGRVKKVDFKSRHRDGSWVYFESRGKSMTDQNGEVCLVINSRDLTERKKNELSLQKAYDQMEAMVAARTAELKTARDKLDSIIHTVPDVIFRMSKHRTFTYVSQAVKRYGYAPEELLGQFFLDFVHPDDQALCIQAENDREAFGKALVAMEARFRTKEGTYVPLEVYNRNLEATDEPEQSSKSVSQGIARDITERKIIEDALRESEAQYATVVENASDALVIIQEGKFIFVNRAGSLMTGYEIEELQTFSLDHLAVEEHKKPLLRNYRATLRGRNKHRLYPMKIKTKKGEILEIEVAPLAIPYKGKPAVLAILRDITSRKKAEDLRLEKEKLKAAIETAGAICHELNQPLQTVLGHTELMLMETGSLKNQVKRISILNQEAKRMSQITQKLQNITSFKTRQYLGDTQILDLGQASPGEEPKKKTDQKK